MDAGLQGGGAGPRQHPIPTTTAERLHLAQLKKQEFIQKMEEQRRKQGASASVADTEMQASITLATLRSQLAEKDVALRTAEERLAGMEEDNFELRGQIVTIEVEAQRKAEKEVESLRGKLKFRDRDYQAQQQELNDKDREFKRLKKDLESQIAAADKKRRKAEEEAKLASAQIEEQVEMRLKAEQALLATKEVPAPAAVAVTTGKEGRLTSDASAPEPMGDHDRHPAPPQMAVRRRSLKDYLELECEQDIFCLLQPEWHTNQGLPSPAMYLQSPRAFSGSIDVTASDQKLHIPRRTKSFLELSAKRGAPLPPSADFAMNHEGARSLLSEGLYSCLGDPGKGQDQGCMLVTVLLNYMEALGSSEATEHHLLAALSLLRSTLTFSHQAWSLMSPHVSDSTPARATSGGRINGYEAEADMAWNEILLDAHSLQPCVSASTLTKPTSVADRLRELLIRLFHSSTSGGQHKICLSVCSVLTVCLHSASESGLLLWQGLLVGRSFEDFLLSKGARSDVKESALLVLRSLMRNKTLFETVSECRSSASPDEPREPFLRRLFATFNIPSALKPEDLGSFLFLTRLCSFLCVLYGNSAYLHLLNDPEEGSGKMRLLLIPRLISFTYLEVEDWETAYKKQKLKLCLPKGEEATIQQLRGTLIKESFRLLVRLCGHSKSSLSNLVFDDMSCMFFVLVDKLLNNNNFECLGVTEDASLLRQYIESLCRKSC